jgi:hypothetical protein
MANSIAIIPFLSLEIALIHRKNVGRKLRKQGNQNWGKKFLNQIKFEFFRRVCYRLFVTVFFNKFLFKSSHMAKIIFIETKLKQNRGSDANLYIKCF